MKVPVFSIPWFNSLNVFTMSSTCIVDQCLSIIQLFPNSKWVQKLEVERAIQQQPMLEADLQEENGELKSRVAQHYLLSVVIKSNALTKNTGDDSDIVRVKHPQHDSILPSLTPLI